MDVVSDLNLSFAEDADVFVLLKVTCLQKPSHRYASWADFVPLDAVLQSLPDLPLPAKPSKRECRSSSNTAERLVENFPWLAEYVRAPRQGSASSTAQPSTPRAVAERVSVIEAELPDDEVDDIFRKLEQKREACRALGPASVEHFGCSILGGRWTKTNVGVAADACKAHAIGKEVADFCTRSGLPRSLTLTFSKYTETAANSLGQLWCEVMECLFSLLKADDMLPADIVDLLADLPAARQCTAEFQNFPPTVLLE